MSYAWMGVRDLHALASARFSSPASRARNAAMLVSEFCGRERSQVTLRWQLNAVEISIKVFDQKLDGGPGMHDIKTALDAVCYVHGFKVLAQTQQKDNLVIKLSATIDNMNRAFRRARSCRRSSRQSRRASSGSSSGTWGGHSSTAASCGFCTPTATMQRTHGRC